MAVSAPVRGQLILYYRLLAATFLIGCRSSCVRRSDAARSSPAALKRLTQGAWTSSPSAP